MSYLVDSLRTRSYWKYALFSPSAMSRVLAIIGALYLFVEMLDFFGIYARDEYSGYALLVIALFAVAAALITRRPVTRICYKPAKRDYAIEVVIGDLFDIDGAKVISSSVTFETSLADGSISPGSLQGQMALRDFRGNTNEIDRQITQALSGKPVQPAEIAKNKQDEYPIGTVAKVQSGSRKFYLVAMSRWTREGNAYSNSVMLDEALEGVWSYLAEQGELEAVAVPVMGTGRGRVQLPRKKVIELIAQSFVYASQERTFSPKLTVVISPGDAAANEINLFEIRDYLSQSLHV